MSFVDGYKGEITNGYKYSKATKNGSWGVWYPDQGEDTFNRDKCQQERKAKQEQAELLKRIQAQNSLTNEQRSVAWGEVIAGLTLADDHRQKFLDRGFTPEQIELGGFRTIEKYQPIKSGNIELAGVSSTGKNLTNTGRGILTPIKDDCDRFIGCQVRLDDGRDGRYKWLSSTSWGGAKPNLQNDELPIGIYFGDRSSRIVGIAEGASIKPQLAANKFGINIIGAAGGQWAGSPEQLKAYLEKHHDKTKPVRIYADAAPHHDNAVMGRIHKLSELLRSWGYEVAIAWWGQFNKTDGDIDELTQEQFEAIEYIRPSDFEHLSTYLLRKPDVILKRRYLGKPNGFGDTFNILNDIPNDKFGVGCKAYKGTGKNTLQATIADALHKSQNDEPRPILYVTQLTNLINQASEPMTESNLSGLGLVNIYDIENAKNDDIRKQLIFEAGLFGIATTYDSFLKILQWIPDFAPFYTFLDEAESGCECLLDASTEIASKRTETITAIAQTLRRSKAKYTDAHMFMFDSDLTNVSVDYFCSLVGETVKDAFIIRNDYKVAAGRVAYVYEDAETWVKAYQETGDRTICFANSQKITAKYSAQKLGELTGDALVIDSDTTKDKTHNAYRALSSKDYATELMSKYQRTVHTSSMGIGISIEQVGLFDSKWALSFGLLGVGKFLQGVDRYRPDIPLHIHVAKWGRGKVGSGSTNWKTLVKESFKNKNNHIAELAIADAELSDASLLNKSVETHAKLAARRNYELANYSQAVERQLRLDGYSIIKVDKAGDKTASDALKDLRDASIEKYCDAVPQANITDELELKRLEKAKEHTPDERLKLAKKRLDDIYQIPVTPELVKEDLSGIYSKLRLSYYLTIGADYLPKRDKSKLETLLGDDRLLFAPDANKSLLSGKIAILRKIEINKFVESIGADAVTNDDDRAIAFNKKLISDFYRFPLRRHLGVNIDPSAKPLTNIKKVLNAIGFDFTRDENSKKAKGRGEYEIKAISNLKDAIFDAWLKRDFRDNFDHQNAETTVSRRKFPNNNIVSREFAEFAEPELKDDFYQVTENIAAAAIEPTAPGPNNKPSNKPSSPPQNESLYDRIRRLNAPLIEFCDYQYQAARYAVSEGLIF
jgi:hypothetical protein